MRTDPNNFPLLLIIEHDFLFCNNGVVFGTPSFAFIAAAIFSSVARIEDYFIQGIFLLFLLVSSSKVLIVQYSFKNQIA